MRSCKDVSPVEAVFSAACSTSSRINTFAVQKKDDILAKCFIRGAIQGEDPDYFVCDIGGR